VLKVFLVALLAVIILLAVAYCAQADVVVARIVEIESAGNPLAHNKKEDARGLCQIRPACLQEYNQRNKTHYTAGDLFNAEINIKIATWYLNKRIPQMLRYFGKPVTCENQIICYNWGIGQFLKYANGKKKLPATTKKYLKDYNETQW